MKRTIAILAGILLSTSAFATGEDLENCRWQNGVPIKQSVCDSMRRHDAETAARKAKEAEQRREAQRQHDEYLAKRQAEQEESKKRQAEHKVKFEREEAERKAAAEQAQREQAEYERSVAKKQQERKAECGDDYATPRIGMTLERANRCVGTFKLVSQLNRADGVVSTYRAGRIHIHVMGGKVAAWNRY